MEQRSLRIAEQVVDSVFKASESIEKPGKQNLAKSEAEAESALLAETRAWDPLPFADSIRVLRLEACEEPTAELHGQLLLCRLSEIPRYEGLSYNWGPRTISGALQLKCGRRLDLAGNLESALRALRLHTRPRQLWIDAICINQNSPEEKARQVAIMSKIFKGAGNVLCWLGPAASTTEAALGFLERQADAAVAYGFSDLERHMPSVLQVQRLEAGRAAAEGIIQEADELKVTEVYNRKYFTRLWVCQEVALASDISIHVGKLSITWRKFVAATLVILGAAETLSMRGLDWIAPAWSIMALRTKVTFNALPGVFVLSPYAEFGALLRSILHHDCQDDRDRIFALIGLKPADCDITIIPDYKKPVTQIYTEFARGFLRYDVHLLSHAGLYARLESETSRILEESDMFANGHLPSWVPDYRLPMSQVPSLPWNDDSFQTATDIPPSATTVPNLPCRIQVRGFLFDVIECVTGAHECGGRNLILQPATTRTFIGSLLEMMIEKANKNIAPEPDGTSKLIPDKDVTRLADVLLLGGHCGELNSAIPHNPKLSRTDLLRFYLKHYIVADEIPPDYTPARGERLRGIDAEMQMARDFAKCLRIMLGTYGLSFVMTEQFGELGWVPAATKKDDIIAVIDGASTPFVLRPMKTLKLLPNDAHEIDHSFQLIGPCYIEGVMMGETTRSELFNERWGMIPID